MDSSILDDFVVSDSDAFSPEKPKAKAKATTKKAAAPKTKTAGTKTTKPAAPKKTKTTVSKKRAKPDTEDEASDPELDSLLRDDSDSIMNTTPPSAKKPKKAKATKASGQPLEDLTNVDGAGDGRPKQGGASDQYEKLTQYEHILKRPDTYIGSVERTKTPLWVYNKSTNSMEFRTVNYVPGLYKIFDEILVNAADNKQRDDSMNSIKVTIDRASGEISVMNNGRGIPVEKHTKEKMYIPELIFGHLLTSSNYDDAQLKTVGGRNGYGAKLANIFSTEFSLDTADAVNHKKYKQTWTKNMSVKGEAKITANKSDNYTKVTFKPDFAKFGMDGMDDDFEALAMRRVYDIAGTCNGVKVSLNGESIKIKGFKQYIEMYAKAISKERVVNEKDEAAKYVVITDKPHERWEIGFAVSDGSFQQVSFVNSIATTNGGTHVNFIADQIVAKLQKAVEKANKKGIALKPNQIRNHIFVFVNCLIENPAFTSQTKEQMTTKSSQFGSKPQVGDSFLNKILKTEVLTNIKHFAQLKADQALGKTDGNRRSRMDNTKLVDANKAGTTKYGHMCTLILTEGDSAKNLAMAGRAVVGADFFGVFPLRGKLLNVRDASIDQIGKNAEIQAIKKIIGLKHKFNYEDTKSLRYGHIMIMTDQDHDGSHIKGLIINFLHHSFPSLLNIPEFLMEFITPIVKVYQGDPKHPKKFHWFYTMPEYEAFKETQGSSTLWEHKYYKGLGTSSTEEAQAYFRDLDRHLKEFHTLKEGDDKLIELAFAKKKADERKEWLRQFKPGTYLDQSLKKITYDDFINKELILFSIADCARSIPSVIDGFKPGQRKVLHACFKRNLKKDMKVVELAGYISGSTAYQHGEASLQQTIVGMAQNFVGANNVNYLEPSGSFGSRLQGGTDSASPRYIYTRLSPFARKVFSPLDAPLLTYNTDDERPIEPELFCPVVPMILINGAEGIGTGWSTNIPNYNPKDVVDNLLRMMDDEEPSDMIPWYRGWSGTVTKTEDNKWKFTGIIRQASNKELEITELPIKTWTQDFKDKLEDIIKAEKVPSFIKDYSDYNTHEKVNFLIQLDEKNMQKVIEEGMIEKFKLSKSLGNTNMVAFDEAGRLRRYTSVLEILREFYGHRLVMYQKRKAYQLDDLQKQLEKLTNQARFVKMIIDGKLIVGKKKKAVLVAELRDKGFRPFPKVKEAKKAGETQDAQEDDEDGEQEKETGAGDFDYLLGMAIWSLTQERVDRLLKQIGDKEEEINVLTALSPKDLWKSDLKDFTEVWEAQLDDEAKRAKKAATLGRRGSSKLKVSAKDPAVRKRKAAGDDPDDEDFAASKPKKTKVVKKPTSTSVFDHLKAKPAKPAAKAKPNGLALDGSSDPMEIDDDVPDKPAAGGRAARKVVKKAVNYDLDSDSESDSGNDMLGDVSKMVKGIENTGPSEVPNGTRPLFSSSSTSRPGSSAGLPKMTKSKRVSEFTDDETDFSKLIPHSSPRKSLSAISRPAALSEADESDSMDIQPVAKPVAKSSKAAANKAPAKSAAAASKGKTKTAAAAKSKPAAAPKPAAKGRVTKKADAFDLPDSDGDVDLQSSEVEVVARPSRRAAAAKRKPIVLDDSDEDEESEVDSDAF